MARRDGLRAVAFAIEMYASGAFPMDGPEHARGPIPYYLADPRAIFELDEQALADLRRRLRRSLRAGVSWTLARDRAFDRTLTACATDRDDVWLTDRLAALYRGLHAAGVAHSYELWDGERLLAGVLAVRLGRAAMLESMFHAAPHAGNVALVRTLEALVAEGVVLCDVQVLTPHTERLGAREIPLAEYQVRLADALRRAGDGGGGHPE